MAATYAGYVQAMTGADPDRQDDPDDIDPPPGIVTAVVDALDDQRIRAFIAHVGVTIAAITAVAASLIEFGAAGALYTLAACTLGIALLYGLGS